MYQDMSFICFFWLAQKVFELYASEGFLSNHLEDNHYGYMVQGCETMGSRLPQPSDQRLGEPDLFYEPNYDIKLSKIWSPTIEAPSLENFDSWNTECKESAMFDNIFDSSSVKELFGLSNQPTQAFKPLNVLSNPVVSGTSNMEEAPVSTLLPKDNLKAPLDSNPYLHIETLNDNEVSTNSRIQHTSVIGRPETNPIDEHQQKALLSTEKGKANQAVKILTGKRRLNSLKSMITFKNSEKFVNTNCIDPFKEGSMYRIPDNNYIQDPTGPGSHHQLIHFNHNFQFEHPYNQKDLESLNVSEMGPKQINHHVYEEIATIPMKENNSFELQFQTKQSLSKDTMGLDVNILESQNVWKAPMSSRKHQRTPEESLSKEERMGKSMRIHNFQNIQDFFNPSFADAIREGLIDQIPGNCHIQNFERTSSQVERMYHHIKQPEFCHHQYDQGNPRHSKLWVKQTNQNVAMGSRTGPVKDVSSSEQSDKVEQNQTNGKMAPQNLNLASEAEMLRLHRNRSRIYIYHIINDGKNFISNADPSGEHMNALCQFIDKKMELILNMIFPNVNAEEFGKITRWKSQHILFPLFIDKVFWAKKLFETESESTSCLDTSILFKSAINSYESWHVEKVKKGYQLLKNYKESGRWRDLFQLLMNNPTRTLVTDLLHLEFGSGEDQISTMSWEIFMEWIPQEFLNWLENKYGTSKKFKPLYNSEVEQKYAHHDRKSLPNLWNTFRTQNQWPLMKLNARNRHLYQSGLWN
ncbi:hypothetical protein CROQUDRAFT_131984 [Cronartium quercuum f. sp. fusiforme G11]|uniref:Uncharacterized protein n=1 Tax=Cronartium quercuum f. sp. fusiforme G11 TaxID=708437 RepID=A0A9P6TDF4_9BASI|nr:hypothetical protein CROQUDRAFT_131984 [Cronartium quercuum f. sp. fusiforme G11]